MLTSLETVTEQKVIAAVALADAQVVPQRSLQEWADAGTSQWRKSVGAIIGAGHVVIQAKKDYPHGGFAKIFKDHPQAVERPFKVTQHTGEALMRIARHPVLSNPIHWIDLPPSWRTLDVLEHLTAPEMEAHLASGAIHPEMTRASATALVPDPNGPWQDHWQGMPEFISNDLTPWKQLIVSFQSQEDLLKFAQVIGQSLTPKTKSVWFPPQAGVPFKSTPPIKSAPRQDTPNAETIQSLKDDQAKLVSYVTLVNEALSAPLVIGEGVYWVPSFEYTASTPPIKAPHRCECGLEHEDQRVSQKRLVPRRKLVRVKKSPVKNYYRR